MVVQGNSSLKFRSCTRRHRRHHQAEGDHHRRHPRRQSRHYLLLAREAPRAFHTFAVEPKTRADEDKIGVAIHKIMEEDPALRFSRDPQTKEFLLAGSGQQHIEVVVAKMQKRYNVNLTLKAAQGSYRETIRGKADAEASTRNSPAGTASSAFAASNSAS